MNDVSKMNDSEIENHWTDIAKSILLNKKIIAVRYVHQDEADDMDWSSRPIAFMLEGGTWIFASMDDEGNDGGALFTSLVDNPVLPVLR